MKISNKRVKFMLKMVVAIVICCIFYILATKGIRWIIHWILFVWVYWLAPVCIPMLIIIGLCWLIGRKLGGKR